MRNNPLMFILFLVIVIVAIDAYTFKGIRHIYNHLTINKRFWIYFVYWLIPVILLVGIVVLFSMEKQLRESKNFTLFYYLVGYMALFYLPKLFFVLFHLTEDIIRLIAVGVKSLTPAESKMADSGEKISRMKFLSQIGLVLSILPFISVIWGILRGRFNFKVRKYTLYFEHLPSAFDGFRIVQFSDTHVGSFYNHEKELEKGIQLINEQQPDLLFFTGDMVNNLSQEMADMLPYLKKAKANVGKYSILGNHDYGDYHAWPSLSEKEKNLQQLIDNHKKAGFTIMLNDSDKLKLKDQEIAVIGVENWGKPPFPQHGNYDKAVKRVKDVGFKILLSHDPTHWDEKILGKTDVALTLSGHTHGFQMGVDIPGVKWSPVKWKYPRWDGLYKEGNQYLHVNRGFGFIALPARIGMPPEVTVIDLKTKKA